VTNASFTSCFGQYASWPHTSRLFDQGFGMDAPSAAGIQCKGPLGRDVYVPARGNYTHKAMHNF